MFEICYSKSWADSGWVYLSTKCAQFLCVSFGVSALPYKVARPWPCCSEYSFVKEPGSVCQYATHTWSLCFFVVCEALQILLFASENELLQPLLLSFYQWHWTQFCLWACHFQTLSFLFFASALWHTYLFTLFLRVGETRTGIISHHVFLSYNSS